MAPETTGAEGTQVDPTSQPQAGTGSPSQAEGAQTAQAASAAGESGTDVAALQRELADLRKSEAKYRNENKRLVDAQKAADEAQLSEAERLRKQVAELTAERETLNRKQQEQAVRMAVLTEAQKLSFPNPAIAYRLIDLDAVEYHEDGTPKNVKSLLQELQKAEPYLTSAHARPAGSADQGARGGAPSAAELAKQAEAKGDWKTAINAKTRQLQEMKARN
jgi:hypothetical protein